jgi:hypothetical protein
MAGFYRRDRAPAMFDFAPEKISAKKSDWPVKKNRI